VTEGTYRFFHDIFITMVRDKLFLPLDIGKGKTADFWTFAIRSYRMPFYALEFQKEVQNIDRVNKVDESISNIALGL
jgi:hypothetical protein